VLGVTAAVGGLAMSGGIAPKLTVQEQLCFVAPYRCSGGAAFGRNARMAVSIFARRVSERQGRMRTNRSTTLLDTKRPRPCCDTATSTEPPPPPCGSIGKRRLSRGWFCLPRDGDGELSGSCLRGNDDLI
jgi:hypothetical protein